MNQTNLPVHLSTLNQQISALTERLSPASDETVTEAIKSLLSAGLSLPGGMAADKAPEIYAFALSKVSATGVRRSVAKLVRGEYDLRNKAFIPTPPEFADMARRETREIVDDLARLKKIRESMTPVSPPVVDEEAKARIRALHATYRQGRSVGVAAQGRQPINEPITPERAAILEKIMALPDAPEISVEQMAERRRADFELEQISGNARSAA